MILQNEIQDKSEVWKVPPDTVDKDWVLGHFLQAFFKEDGHHASLVFKGGTCLRKCYFQDYRFSEDLDFTAIEPEYSLTKDSLDRIVKRAFDNSGIRFHPLPIQEMQYQDKRTGDQVKIMYWGANHRRDSAPSDDPERWHHSIKLEITIYEKLVFEPVQRRILHPYSDSLKDSGKHIPCYDLREVMAEKIRSLIQRRYSAPRDFYDVWMLKEKFRETDWHDIDSAFHEKMKFKGYQYETIEQLIHNGSIEHLRKSWGKSLGHQVPSKMAPDMDQVVADLRALFNEKLTLSNGH